jgi:hypothetical protein
VRTGPGPRADSLWLRRRAIRPGEEYRTPTDEEWEEFLGHFERRKVALGECGRASSSPCIHEHSCIRCPLLRVEPGQRQRLADIRVNLTARIAEAQREGWPGEAEGLKVSLAAAEAKLSQVDSLIARRHDAVSLGMPSFITASPADGIPVDLRDTLTGLEDRNIQLLFTAICRASGKPS